MLDFDKIFEWEKVKTSDVGVILWFIYLYQCMWYTAFYLCILTINSWDNTNLIVNDGFLFVAELRFQVSYNFYRYEYFLAIVFLKKISELPCVYVCSFIVCVSAWISVSRYICGGQHRFSPAFMWVLDMECRPSGLPSKCLYRLNQLIAPLAPPPPSRQGLSM